MQNICFAQADAASNQLLKMKHGADSLSIQYPAEKIYLQLDKKIYNAGDTLWFKGYVFHARTLGLSAQSGIMYIDVATDSNLLVKRIRIPVKEGLTWGNISLKSLPAGNYTLKAYTNWMRNFEDAGTFYTHFDITSDAGSNWLVNYKSEFTTTGGSGNVDVRLILNNFNRQPVTDKQVQLFVMRNKRVLFKKAVQTDDHGYIDVNFKPPGNIRGLRLAVHDENNNMINVPLNISRPNDADVQFMPEGGELIAGFPVRIGFKAIGLDGKGIDITGEVYDENKQKITGFSSSHLGIGSFSLQANGKAYTALVALPGGITKEFALPKVKSSGTSLKVNEIPGTDSVNISAYATTDIINSGNSFFLIGKARQTICYAASFNFNTTGRLSKNVSKKLFPTGITHFILADSKSETLNERLVFINHHDGLRLSVNTDKTIYTLHDSVAMHIAVNDIFGNPSRANFSLAVTDDSQVHLDTLNDENIFTRVYLTSELKGYIEQPGYYFSGKDSRHSSDLDNLLLTQGWISYDWPAPKNRVVFNAETDFAVKGRVINFFNKPVRKTKVSLLSKSPLLVTDVLTDSTGHFTFNNFPQIDTPAFIIKTAKNFNVSILMDDPPAAEFVAPFSPSPVPWYAKNDTALLAGVKNNRIKQRLVDSLPLGEHVLKEVVITARKIVKGSQNLNGSGNADMVFDEADLEAAGKQNWLQFLEKNVPGFRVGAIRRPLSVKNFIEIAHYYALKYSLQDKHAADLADPPPISTGETYNFQWYFINDKPIKILVDGVPIMEVFKSPNIDEPNFITMKNYLERFNAEDIKGIEVNKSSRYYSKYFQRYIFSEWRPSVDPSDIAFLEITTRAGKGPDIKSTAGSYLYKPLALSMPARFYTPRYLVNDTAKKAADLRTTIHWEPNVTTNADGKALVSFYCANKPSTYTYILEGTNLDGSLGYICGKIKVNSNTNP